MALGSKGIRYTIGPIGVVDCWWLVDHKIKLRVRSNGSSYERWFISCNFCVRCGVRMSVQFWQCFNYVETLLETEPRILV